MPKAIKKETVLRLTGEFVLSAYDRKDIEKILIDFGFYLKDYSLKDLCGAYPQYFDCSVQTNCAVKISDIFSHKEKRFIVVGTFEREYGEVMDRFRDYRITLLGHQKHYMYVYDITELGLLARLWITSMDKNLIEKIRFGNGEATKIVLENGLVKEADSSLGMGIILENKTVYDDGFVHGLISSLNKAAGIMIGRGLEIKIKTK